MGAVGTPGFFFDLASDMSNDGGSIVAFNGVEGPCGRLNPPFDTCDGVQVSSGRIHWWGTVVASPAVAMSEPNSLLLMTFAFGGMIVVRRFSTS